MVKRSILDRRIKPDKDEHDEVYLKEGSKSVEESDASAQDAVIEDSLDENVNIDNQRGDGSKTEEEDPKSDVQDPEDAFDLIN